MLIDTHAHLNFPDYPEELIPEIIQRANAADVKNIINVGTNLETSIKSITLAEKYSNIFATVGIHPQDAHQTNENDLQTIYELARDNVQVVAIGEIGLDYFKAKNSPEIQLTIFKAMLQMAKELGLPYIVHNREAAENVLQILKELNYPNGVMHCFGGDLKLAEEIIALGLKISFTGIITFKNAVTVQEVAKTIPLTSIMLETDAPFLAPQPFRGQRNEPAYVHYIAEKLAALKEIPLEKVKEITSANAFSFFSKMPQT